jgi:DNA-binding response OmpR family regulator
MKKYILIVDDEPNVRLNYRVALETEGYFVNEANSGAKALDELEVSKFDLAILDMRMPEMDGLELLAEMRKRGHTTPSIIVTAYGDIPHAVQAMKLGAIDFLQKPLTPEALRKIVTDLLERHAPVPAGQQTPKPPADDFDTHVVTAKRLLNLQDFAGAKNHLVRAMELDGNAEAFNLAGVLFEMQEDYERAKKYYGHAIKLDRRYEPAQQNMRRIYELFNFGSSKEPFNLGEGQSVL